MNIQTNYTNPSFGFNIKVREAGKLTNIEHSQVFGKQELEARVTKLCERAKKVMPEKTVVIEASKQNENNIPQYNVNYSVDGAIKYTQKNSAGGILYTLENACNPLRSAHSYIFYTGSQSPERIALNAKIKAALV